MERKKAGGFSNKWAVITLHPWLPGRSEQIARARAWGVEESKLGRNDVSALIEDDVRKVKRTTNWPSKLPNRASFIARRQAEAKERGPLEDQVFFATPLAVGFSANHARQTVEGLWEAGCLVYVHSTASLYRAGDDLDDFFEQIGRDANAAHVRASRARGSS